MPSLAITPRDTDVSGEEEYVASRDGGKEGCVGRGMVTKWERHGRECWVCGSKRACDRGENYSEKDESKGHLKSTAM